MDLIHKRFDVFVEKCKTATCFGIGFFIAEAAINGGHMAGRFSFVVVLSRLGAPHPRQVDLAADALQTVCAGGRPPEACVVVDDHGRTSVDGVWAVGDATASVDAVTGAVRPVALAGPANRAGRLVADAILRPDSARPLPSPLGTAIVRAGSLTAALTGANRAGLDAAGIEIPFPQRELRVRPPATVELPRP